MIMSYVSDQVLSELIAVDSAVDGVKETPVEASVGAENESTANESTANETAAH